jgi:hypothetical protein
VNIEPISFYPVGEHPPVELLDLFVQLDSAGASAGQILAFRLLKEGAGNANDE